METVRSHLSYPQIRPITLCALGAVQGSSRLQAGPRPGAGAALLGGRLVARLKQHREPETTINITSPGKSLGQEEHSSIFWSVFFSTYIETSLFSSFSKHKLEFLGTFSVTGQMLNVLLCSESSLLSKFKYLA